MLDISYFVLNLALCFRTAPCTCAGAAVALERLLRAALIDELCEWAEVHADLGVLQQGVPALPAVCTHAASIPRMSPEQVTLDPWAWFNRCFSLKAHCMRDCAALP